MKKNLDMTEGKPLSLLWAFTFPTLMGNLLHQAYSITDSIVVGRYLGQTHAGGPAAGGIDDRRQRGGRHHHQPLFRPEK